MISNLKHEFSHVLLRRLITLQYQTVFVNYFFLFACISSNDHLLNNAKKKFVSNTWYPNTVRNKRQEEYISNFSSKCLQWKIWLCSCVKFCFPCVLVSGDLTWTKDYSINTNKMKEKLNTEICLLCTLQVNPFPVK